MRRLITFLYITAAALVVLQAVGLLVPGVGAQTTAMVRAMLVDSSGTELELGDDYEENFAAPLDPLGPTVLYRRDDNLDDLIEIEDDWVTPRVDEHGGLWVAIDHHFADNIAVVHDASAGTSLSAIAAAGSGIRNYITDLECTNSSATDVTVDIRDGTAGAVIWKLACPAGGGNNRAFSRPLRGAANTILAVDASAAATSVHVSINGFKRAD